MHPNVYSYSVVVVVVALAGCSKRMEEARAMEAATRAQTVKQASLAYRLRSTKCPTMADLVSARQLAEAKPDPWGTPFLIECRDDDIVVKSAGPDKRFGSPDDIAAK